MVTPVEETRIYREEAVGKDGTRRPLVVVVSYTPAQPDRTDDERWPALHADAWLAEHYDAPEATRPGAGYMARAYLVRDDAAVSGMMELPRDDYARLGIPEVCLLVLRKHAQRPLYSSTWSQDESLHWLHADYISVDAGQVWDRLGVPRNPVLMRYVLP